MEKTAPGIDLAGYASELYLAGSWEAGAGRPIEAARKLREAAQIWGDAATQLGRSHAAESIRQFINQWVALLEAGDLPSAREAARRIERELGLLATVNPGLQSCLARDWVTAQDGKKQRIDQWNQDWADLLREMGPEQDAKRVSRATIERWRARYPGLAFSHWLCARMAHRDGDLKSAREHLDLACELDAENAAYQALRIHLVVATEPDAAGYERATSIYREFRPRSARVRYVYALALLQPGPKRILGRDKALEQAAIVASEALDMSPSDLSPASRAWAQLLRQYCEWQLGYPGVPNPFDAPMLPIQGDEPCFLAPPDTRDLPVRPGEERLDALFVGAASPAA